MMQWWLKNGYDGEVAKQSEAARIMETKKMTEFLKSKYDAVWFKGKSMYKLLDGDQIAVYDPSHIYFIDNTNVEPMTIGAKVRRKVDRHANKWDNSTPVVTPTGTIGVIMNKQSTKETLPATPPRQTGFADQNFLIELNGRGAEPNQMSLTKILNRNEPT
jgi:hypothetical protein